MCVILKIRIYSLTANIVLILPLLFSGCAGKTVERADVSSAQTRPETAVDSSEDTVSEPESAALNASSGGSAHSSAIQSKAASSAASSGAPSGAIPPPALPSAAVVTSTVCPLYRKADATSTLDTQALYNQPVTVKSKTGSFLYVTVVDGYTGYIKESNVTNSTASLAGDKHVVVTKTMAEIDWTRPVGFTGTVPPEKVPMGTELFGKFENGWFFASLPGGGEGRLNADDIKEIADEKLQFDGDGSKIVATANLFKGTKYLWGGVSVLGIDCSGLTYISYRMNGITLPRDAEPQSKEGQKISIDEALPGDLMFFSKNTDKVGVSHVGIYIGNGNFIHSSVANNGYSQSNHISETYFAQRLVSINRYY